MDHRQGKKKPGNETLFTSELGENPTDDAMGIPTGSFLPLIPLFSTSDSDNELSSMGLLCLRRNNPLVPSSTPSPKSRRLTFNFDPEIRRKINHQTLVIGPLGSGALTNFYARPKQLHSPSCLITHLELDTWVCDWISIANFVFSIDTRGETFACKLI